MITEQQLLDFMRETAYKPMTYQELEQHFQIEDAADFRAFDYAEYAGGIRPNFADE